MEKLSRLTLVIVFSCVILLGAGVALVVETFTKVPNFSELRGQVIVPIELPGDIKSTKMMGPGTASWVPLSQISIQAMGAVVSSEDTSFFSNEGVDYHELRESIKKDLEEGKFARGASTITQQVIKNVYLGQEKTLWRKFKEFFWAQKMAKVLSKSEILAFYLNMVEWGPGLYGIKEASQHYFGRSPAELTAKQGAFLALLLPSPKKYHSYFNDKKLSTWAQTRIEKILKVMLSMKFIDETEYETALTETLWEVKDSFENKVEEESEVIDSEEPNP
ncbi:MAG: transglycosylase domain-containing protein [Pseudomonadota bacterium]